MSAPVDVLAFLDAEIASARGLSADAYYVQQLPKLEAVRAALAEMIETQRALLAEYGPGIASMRVDAPRRALWLRSRDALARIGGAA